MGAVNDELGFIRFAKTDKTAYQKYLELKYQVFYREFGWNSLRVSDGSCMAIPDPIDNMAIFFGCYNDDRLVGVSRVVYSNLSIAYEDLYQKYIADGILQGMFGVLNAIAVVPEYRGKKICINERGGLHTIGEQLICNIERYSMESGCRSLILTAGCNGSEKFFRRRGYHRLSECYG